MALRDCSRPAPVGVERPTGLHQQVSTDQHVSRRRRETSLKGTPLERLEQSPRASRGVGRRPSKAPRRPTLVPGLAFRALLVRVAGGEGGPGAWRALVSYQGPRSIPHVIKCLTVRVPGGSSSRRVLAAPQRGPALVCALRPLLSHGGGAAASSLACPSARRVSDAPPATPLPRVMKDTELSSRATPLSRRPSPAARHDLCLGGGTRRRQLLAEVPFKAEQLVTRDGLRVPPPPPRRPTIQPDLARSGPARPVGRGAEGGW